jgi:hypothetical protein
MLIRKDIYFKHCTDIVNYMSCIIGQIHFQFCIFSSCYSKPSGQNHKRLMVVTTLLSLRAFGGPYASCHVVQANMLLLADKAIL